MIKMHLTGENGNYYATPISDKEANVLNRNGECVVEIPKAKALEWEEMLLKMRQWNQYWKQLSNDWLKETYPEVYL